MPANEKERTPHTMNVDRHAPTSEAMARIHISNLSESQPMVVPETVLATLRAVSVNEDCDALRPSDEANARKRHQIVSNYYELYVFLHTWKPCRRYKVT